MFARWLKALRYKAEENFKFKEVEPERQCTHCGATSPEKHIPSWIILHEVFNAFMMGDPPPITGRFCSAICVMNFLYKRVTTKRMKLETISEADYEIKTGKFNNVMQRSVNL